MNNLQTCKCVGVDARNNCDCNTRNHLRYPRVIFASKLSLIIFIGLCGHVKLLIVHSYVTQLVGLSVDCLSSLTRQVSQLMMGESSLASKEDPLSMSSSREFKVALYLLVTNWDRVVS